MIIAVAFGLVVLIVGVQILRWYASADIGTIKRSLKWTAIALLGLVVLFLAVTGRIGPALALMGALLVWSWRILNMIHLGRQFGGMFRSFGFGRGGGRAAGRSSEVDSRYLRMRLDHDTGALDGEVREGRFAGRRLSNLDRAALIDLLQEIQADRESASLLEAYLDRLHPDWRAQGQRQENPPPASSTMTTDEAYRILGLPPESDDDAIKAAYRRLMAQLHPDRGGSDYLAAKVNQARDFLLKSRPSI